MLQRAAPASSFESTFRAADGALYVLGKSELRVAKLQAWTERVEALVVGNEWMDALALALDQYEAIIKANELAAAAAEAKARRLEKAGVEGMRAPARAVVVCLGGHAPPPLSLQSSTRARLSGCENAACRSTSKRRSRSF